jgi:hypothetical protein
MSAFIARKWIELNWLRKGHKEIDLPEVIYISPKIGYSAAYYRPVKEEIFIEGRYYNREKGIIVLVDNRREEDKGFASSIAHEWRHHWQFHKGFLLPLSAKRPYDPEKAAENYKREIIQFFKQNSDEMDALLFSVRKVPCDYELEWIEWIRGE